MWVDLGCNLPAEEAVHELFQFFPFGFAFSKAAESCEPGESRFEVNTERSRPSFQSVPIMTEEHRLAEKPALFKSRDESPHRHLDAVCIHLIAVEDRKLLHHERDSFQSWMMKLPLVALFDGDATEKNMRSSYRKSRQAW